MKCEDYDDGVWNAVRLPKFTIDSNSDVLMDFIDSDSFDSSNFDGLSDNSLHDSMLDFIHHEDTDNNYAENKSEFMGREFTNIVTETETAISLQENVVMRKSSFCNNNLTIEDPIFLKWWSNLDLQKPIILADPVCSPSMSFLKKPVKQQSVKQSLSWIEKLLIVVILVCSQIAYFSTLKLLINSTSESMLRQKYAVSKNSTGASLFDMFTTNSLKLGEFFKDFGYVTDVSFGGNSSHRILYKKNASLVPTMDPLLFSDSFIVFNNISHSYFFCEPSILGYF